MSVEKITFILTKCYLFPFSSNKSHLWPKSFRCFLWFIDQPWKNKQIKCWNVGESLLGILSRRLQSPKESQTLTDMAASSETPYPTSFIFIDEKIKLRKVKWLLQSHSAGWWNRGISNSLFFWLWVPIASCPESTHGFLKSFSALPGRPNSACYLFLQIKFY